MEVLLESWCARGAWRLADLGLPEPEGPQHVGYADALMWLAEEERRLLEVPSEDDDGWRDSEAWAKLARPPEPMTVAGALNFLDRAARASGDEGQECIGECVAYLRRVWEHLDPPELERRSAKAQEIYREKAPQETWRVVAERMRDALMGRDDGV